MSRKRPELTQETIVATALKLAAEGGDAAATFRKIGQAAGGYEGMALYTHVKSAEHLRALMLEQITAPATAAAVNTLAALPDPEPGNPDPGRVARALRRLLIENWAAGNPIQPGPLASLVHRFGGGGG